MRQASIAAAIALTFAFVSNHAMAQIRDNSLPAGASSGILSGTPSGTPAGTMPRLTTPPVTDTAPTAGRSSACGSVGSSCLSAPGMLRPEEHGRR